MTEINTHTGSAWLSVLLILWTFVRLSIPQMTLIWHRLQTTQTDKWDK